MKNEKQLKTDLVCTNITSTEKFLGNCQEVTKNKFSNIKTNLKYYINKLIWILNLLKRNLIYAHHKQTEKN